MSAVLLTILFLVISNVFMTFAWYGHLKLQATGTASNWPLYIVILFSWGIALFEFCFQVPANRIGFDGNGGPFSLIQLKVMQEVITLVVFSIFSIFYLKEDFQWNYLVGFLFIILAVFFIFKKW